MIKKRLHTLALKLLQNKTLEPFIVRTYSRLFTPPIEHYADGTFKEFLTTQFHQGLLNSRIIPYHPNRIWPFWVYQQLSPKSPSYQNHAGILSQINSTHRSWTTLSLPNHNEAVTIDPRGLVTPYKNGWSVDIWVKVDDAITPQSLTQTCKQQFNPQANAITTHFSANAITVSTETIVSNTLDKDPLAINKLTCFNKSDNEISFSLFIAIRPYNPEGIMPIKNIAYLTSNAFVVDNVLGPVFDTKPDNIVYLDFDNGDAFEKIDRYDMILSTQCKKNLASGYAEYKLTLPPKKTQDITYSLPLKRASIAKNIKKAMTQTEQSLLLTRIKNIQSKLFQDEKNNTIKYLQNTSSSLGTFEIPEPTTQGILSKSIAITLNSIGHNRFLSKGIDMAPLPIKDLYFIVNALQTLNTPHMMNPIIQSIHHYKTKLIHQNLSEPCYDEYGMLILLIHQVYLFTKDKSFLEIHFSTIKKAAHVLIKARSKPLGLISGPLRDGSYSIDTYSWTNYWGIAGLKSTLTIYKTLGKFDGVATLTSQIQNWETSLTKFFESQSVTYIPISKQRKVDSSICHSLVSSYPLGLETPDSSRITETLHILEQLHTNSGIFFSSIGPAGYPLHENNVLAQLYASRQDPKCFTLLRWLNTTHQAFNIWPDIIHPISKGGSYGNGQSVLAHADYILLIKNMIMSEQKNILHLLPCIPEEWLTEEAPLKATNIRTKFGSISLTVKKENTTLRVSFQPTFSRTPDRILFSSPVKIVSFESQKSKTKNINSHTIELPQDVTNFTIILEKEAENAANTTIKSR